MKSITTITKTLFVLLIALLFSVPQALAQVSVGADVVSRYIWRGIDFGQAVSVQPGLSVASGGFEVGAWGSYSNVGAGANELDLWASYSFATGENSSISFGVTDYYFPAAPGQFLTFDEDGNHIIEPFIGFSGPVNLTAYINAMNDPDNSVYVNFGVPFEVEDVSLEFFIGVVPTGSDFEGGGWYGNTDPALQEIGLSASKEIKITDDFSLPFFGSYIINPYQEVSFFYVGISL